MTHVELILLPLGIGVVLLLLQSSLFQAHRLFSVFCRLGSLLTACYLSENYFEQLILISALSITLFSWAKEASDEAFTVPILLSVMGAITCTAARDFLTLFVGIELLTLPIYGLIALNPSNPRNVRAAIKYLVLAGTSSAVLLMGFLYLYIQSKSMKLDLGNSPGSFLVFVGIAFKLSLVPFHVWTGDVYEDSPLPVTAFLATVSKTALVAVLSGLAVPKNLIPVLSMIAVFSMLGGSFLTLRQQNISRFLGYSSIAHMGYILVAWLVGANMEFYMGAYVLTLLVIFWMLSARHPLSKFFLNLGFLSLMGIPLLPVFWGKYQVLVAAMQGQHLVLLSVFLISSFLSVYGYGRMMLQVSQLALLLLFMACSKKEPEVFIQPASEKQITEFKALSIQGLKADQYALLSKLFNDEICPCSACAKSFAACLQDQDTCKPAVLLGQWVVERVRSGVPMEVMAVALSQEINAGFSSVPQIINLQGYQSKGSPGAAYTIVEFADFECLHCKLTSKVVDAFLDKHPEVRLVYKHFPLERHPTAKQAALAAEAAAIQNQFWKMHRALFDSQEAFTEDKLESLAKKLGLNRVKWKKDMEDSVVISKVENSIKEGQQIGIQGTPAIYFNGRPFFLSADMPGLELRLAMEKVRDLSHCK